ncbi:MAG: twitch domain-containing radical SAM protein [Bacteriovoracaceae bacterium]|nr:twitch domain-containing radical SAM protein [Bacteriovoracaceae bacterium]
MSDKNFKDIRDKLNAVSPSFCLAKWNQVTLSLTAGMTHSCHHPVQHKVPLEEIAQHPDALHNTTFKMEQRKKMLEGVRPEECHYCWQIEDSHPDSLSDRTYKSADEWAFPDFEKIKNSKWDDRPNPRYLEVSFGIECNFKCAYCAPNISSGILAEFLKFGHYKEIPLMGLENLKQMGTYPIGKKEDNPYVEAFWKWWPDLKKDLRVFRITGGEPLLSPSTFRFLEELTTVGAKELNVAINSNFVVPEANFNRFIELSKKIVEEKRTASYEVYTSVDTFGDQAEYIRNGLNYQQFLANVRRYLSEVPDVKIVFMVTYNALSVTKFSHLLEDLLKLKSEFCILPDHIPRVMVDISPLRNPHILNCQILTQDFAVYMEKDLEFMKKAKIIGAPYSPAFYNHEISKMERLLNWFKSNQKSEVTDRLDINRWCFSTFCEEYDKRKGTNFEKTFPEYAEFMKLCRSLYDS